MTKRLPLKEVIVSAIDKRYKLFDALGKKAKMLDNNKERNERDLIYAQMRELVLDMECIENYVLNKHQKASRLWHALKDLKELK